MSLAYPAHKVAEAAGRYRRSILEVAKWKKFLSGRVDVAAFAQVIARRVAILAVSRLRDFRRSLGKPMVDDLGSDLVAIARRDIALRFVFVAGDPGQDLLELGAGSALSRLLRQRRVAIERIEGPDHTFTPAWSHPLFLAAVGNALDD